MSDQPTETGIPEDEDNTTEVLLDSTDGEVEIELVDDVPEKDRGRKPLEKPVDEPTDEELGSYSEGVRKRISELTHARHDERRAKEATLREKQELDRIARALAEENRQLREQYNAGARQYVETAGSAADMRLNNARAAFKAAHEAFDTEAILKAQEELNDAQNEWKRVKSFQAPALQPERPVVQPQQEATQAPIDDKTLRWQARNQWWGAPGNEEITLFSLGVHQKLMADGVDPRSDEYFEQIDARLHETFPKFFGTEKGKPKPETRRSAPVVAPGARTANGVRKIQLTPTALALIKRLNITPQQYAAAAVKLEKDNG